MTLQGPADWRFARFVAVGMATAVADVGIVALLLRLDFPYPIAISAGFVVALAVNYLLHAEYTFQSSSKSARQAFRFLLVVLLNYALTMLIVWLGHSGFGIDILICKIASLLPVTVFGYLASKYYVFSRPTAGTPG